MEEQINKRNHKKNGRSRVEGEDTNMNIKEKG